MMNACTQDTSSNEMLTLDEQYPIRSVPAGGWENVISAYEAVLGKDAMVLVVLNNPLDYYIDWFQAMKVRRQSTISILANVVQFLMLLPGPEDLQTGGPVCFLVFGRCML